MFGGQTIDELIEDWELAKEAANIYLDNVNRTYAIDKLSNGYDQLFEKANGNLKLQKEINAAKEAEV